jgi:hypothetical protein
MKRTGCHVHCQRPQGQPRLEEPHDLSRVRLEFLTRHGLREPGVGPISSRPADCSFAHMAPQPAHARVPDGYVRAYPGRSSARARRQVMRPHASCSSARWLSGFFDQRMSRPRKRLSQEWDTAENDPGQQLPRPYLTNPPPAQVTLSDGRGRTSRKFREIDKVGRNPVQARGSSRLRLGRSRFRLRGGLSGGRRVRADENGAHRRWPPLAAAVRGRDGFVVERPCDLGESVAASVFEPNPLDNSPGQCRGCPAVPRSLGSRGGWRCPRRNRSSSATGISRCPQGRLHAVHGRDDTAVDGGDADAERLGPCLRLYARRSASTIS